MKRELTLFLTAMAASSATVNAAKPPVSILPPAILVEPAVVPTQPPQLPVPPAMVVPPAAVPVIVPHWTSADATQLLVVIEGIGKRGLFPADYAPKDLRAAISAGEDDALDLLAGALFTRLATDLRDGRTPSASRVQWIIKDNDADAMPILPLMQSALAARDVGGALASLDPVNADYSVLEAALAVTPAANKARIQLIRANMDRWRWMPQSLGTKHVIANVPEYELRLVVNGRLISSHRVIVGKKDTATPQLSAPAVGVVIHPPWYLPRSIIEESVGALIAKSPSVAKARGYTWTGSGKTLAVIQQAGPASALGYIKIDMPNADAIFLHDTPNRNLFDATDRAFSHGCLRTDRVMELAIILGVLQEGGTADELVALIKAGKTVKVPFKESIPVFIGYFTMGTGLDGKLTTFKDLYGRDAPIVASFEKPRPFEMPAAIPALPVVALKL